MALNKQLKVVFNNGSITVDLYNNEVASILYKKFKHLKNLPLNFQDQDVFFRFKSLSLTQNIDLLKKRARQVSVILDIDKLGKIEYINQLHEEYEKNFDGNPAWLGFHETLHAIENLLLAVPVHPVITFDYRTLAGSLETNFDREYHNFSTYRVYRGECYVKMQELGKHPYMYFASNEPNSIDRLCKLAKPWLKLRPTIHVACADIDFLDGIDLNKFDQWFEPYKTAWCQHWNLNQWHSREQYQVIAIGRIDNLDKLVDRMQVNDDPIRVVPV